ncbi:NAD(P)H-dependent flavin oxidoreductase [Ancylomarina sp. YFZ004]
MNIQELKSSLTLPIIIAPMFLVSGTELVIESCKKGVLGTFPSLNGRTPQDFERMLIEITSALESFKLETGIEPAPFAVNLIVNRTNSRLIPDLQLCVKYKVPLVITSLGASKDVVDAIHQYGGLVFHDIIKKRHAEKAIEVGVDGIIAVAAGAGGHAGTANPFALIDEIRSFYKGPLVLAGAINSGKDILAAENMGADLAYMGTRFIATNESLATDEYKASLIDSHIDDVLYTDAVSGVYGNFLKSSIEKAGIDLNQKKEEYFSELSAQDDKAWKDIWSAGQGVAGINAIITVSHLLDQIKREYTEVLIQNVKKLEKLKS